MVAITLPDFPAWPVWGLEHWIRTHKIWVGVSDLDRVKLPWFPFRSAIASFLSAQCLALWAPG